MLALSGLPFISLSEAKNTSYQVTNLMSVVRVWPNDNFEHLGSILQT